MTVLATYPWTANGTTLGTYAYSIELERGRDMLPARRATSRRIPFHPGVYPHYDVFPGPKRIRLQIWVAPNDADGNVSHSDGGIGHLFDNMDALLDIFGSQGSAISLTREVPVDGGANKTRTIDVRQIRAVPIDGGPMHRRLQVDLEAPYPFWKDSVLNSTVITGNAVALSPVPAGSAEIWDAQYSFPTAGSLTDDATSNVLTVAGTPPNGYPVIVYGGLPRRAIDNNGAGEQVNGLVSSTKPWLHRIKGATTFTKSGTGNPTVSWYDHFH